MLKRAFLSIFLAALLLVSQGPGAQARTVDRTAVTESDRNLVLMLMLYDPRATVRAAATTAYIDDAQDDAIARFLATDYAFAVELARESDATNLDFVRRVLETYLPEFAPEVHAAAQRVVNGSPSEREAFVRVGYAAAQDRDRLAREKSGEAKRAIIEADRAFVRNVGQTDPGEQVRAAASFALRPGAGDGGLVEFFAYGWAGGGRLDLDVHRARAADNDITWRMTATRLAKEALAAEKAASEASEEAAEHLRAQAAQAWRAAAEQTGPARSAWAEAAELSARQAENWRAVAAAAQAATGPNWQAIGGPAVGNEQQWSAEHDWAGERAQYWRDLLAEAQAGETRMARAS